MVRTFGSNGKGHVVDDAFCPYKGTEYKISAVLRFAEHVRDTVDSACSMVEFVMVYVYIRVCCRHDRSDHEGIHLGLGFFQMVATVIVTAFESPCH